MSGRDVACRAKKIKRNTGPLGSKTAGDVPFFRLPCPFPTGITWVFQGTNMAKSETKPAGFGEDDLTRASGWDALLDDVFGLNVRGFRTMWASLFNPAKVFEAARDPGWQDRYTPAIRLVFVIFALTGSLQYLLSGEGTPLWQTVVEAVSAYEGDLYGREVDDIAREVLLAYSVLYSIAFFVLHIPLSLIVSAWGKGVPMPVRSRLYFATLVPGTLIGLALVIGQNAISTEINQTSSLIFMALIILAYVGTIFRGLAPRMSAGGRLWRAGLMGFLMIAVTAIAEFIGLLAAHIYVLGTPPGG